jgi:hypothetical protein
MLGNEAAGREARPGGATASGHRAAQEVQFNAQRRHGRWNVTALQQGAHDFAAWLRCPALSPAPEVGAWEAWLGAGALGDPHLAAVVAQRLQEGRWENDCVERSIVWVQYTVTDLGAAQRHRRLGCRCSAATATVHSPRKVRLCRRDTGRLLPGAAAGRQGWGWRTPLRAAACRDRAAARLRRQVVGSDGSCGRDRRWQPPEPAASDFGRPLWPMIQAAL